MLKKDRLNILFIILLGLIITGLCLKFLPHFPVISDSEEYDTSALNIVEGRGIVLQDDPGEETPPGYPVFLALIYYIFGHDYQVVKFFQFLLLVGMGIIVYLASRKFFNLPYPLAFLVSLTVILWPYFILYPALIVTEIPFTFFLLLATYFLFKFGQNPSIKNSLLPGGLLAITSFIRPTVLLLPFWSVFFLWFFAKSLRTRAYFFKLVMVLLVFSAVLAPWTLKTYLHYHRFVPIVTYLPNVITKAYLKLDYTEGSQALNPWETNFKTMLLARFKNIYLFWNPGGTGSYTQKLQSAFPVLAVFLHIYRVFFFIVLALAFWSLRFIRQNKAVFLAWAIIFYFWAVHIVLFPYPRYTLPIIPLVIILAWLSIQNILGYKSLKRGEKI